MIDMRDPWRGGNKKYPLNGMDPRWIFPLIAPLERILFRSTRIVVVNTREFADELRGAQPQLTVEYLSNGVDLEALPLRTAERFDGISIAYVGTFYAGRSFSTVLDALATVMRDRPRDAAQIKLRIAGQIDPIHADALRATLARDGLSGMVELLGTVPRSQALDLLRRSHLALVLAQEQRTQIPGKIYECVGLGIPTLVITETDSAAAHEARRIGALVVESNDVDGIRRIVGDLLAGIFPSTIRPTAPISYEALALQMHRILTEQCADESLRMQKPALVH